MNNRLLKLIAGTFVVVFLFLLSVNITFAQTSSCQHISGNGPLKIVFLKDESLTKRENELYPNPLYNFKSATEDAIYGFKTIEPFRTYFDKFSFYIDTKENVYNKIKDSSPSDVDKYVKGSTCGSDAFEYVWFIESSVIGSYTKRGFSTVFISIAQFDPFASGFKSIQDYLWRGGFPEDFAANIAMGQAVIHETGHAKGGLSDEYISGGSAIEENCTFDPKEDYKSSFDQKVYGLTNISGCSLPTASRPSQNSIMKEGWAVPEFNVISCGYVVSAILKQDTSWVYQVAQHWPECCKMKGVNKDGVPGCGDTSTITFPPPPEDCLLTDFTNQVTEIATSTDSAVIITAEQDIILPRTEQEGFFKINGTDVSKPDGNGGKIVPSGEQLALIPPGGALNIEMSDIYCREEEIELQAEVEPINTKSPIKSVFGQSVQTDCVNDYDGSTATTSCLMATSSLSIDIPAQRNCIIDSFLATTTQASSSEDILISAEDDVPLTDISVPDGEVNFFKINGTDVSVADGNGGRKIPKGDLITIPAGTEVTYETGDKYCREGELSLSLTQLPVTLERPIVCFFNCK